MRSANSDLVDLASNDYLGLATDPRVIAAMGEVPRHLFLPAEERKSAYQDAALPIGNGQTIEKVSKDIERDKYLTAAEAVEYGIVDDILTSLKDVPH